MVILSGVCADCYKQCACKCLLLNESTDFFYFGSEEKVTSSRSTHHWTEKTVCSRNNRASKRKKKRSRGYKCTQGCLGQTWSSETLWDVCCKCLALVLSFWQAAGGPHQAGADQSYLLEFLMFTQEGLWPTAGSSISWAWGASRTLRIGESFALSSA